MESTFVSTSKSKSIQKIENTYGFKVADCKHYFMDSLTGKFNGEPKIKCISDLMLGSNKFDIENMSDIEKSNLQYIVLSTKEVLDTVKRKTKNIYYKQRYGRLRFLMSYDDFYQICMDKLMLNNGILKFDANYKFECAINFWFDRVAGWKCIRKAKVADEVAILDKPCNEDGDTTIGDLILHKELDEFNETDYESNLRVNLILNQMNNSESTKYVIKAHKTELPYSEQNLAKLFIVYHLGKKELSKIIYNKSNCKPVSNQSFNKLYKQMITDIAVILNKESNEVGEQFEINIDEF